MGIRLALLCGIAVAGFATPLHGQGRGSISGTVVSDRGAAPVAGARVRISTPGGKDTVLVADQKGAFALRRLPAGRYWVVATWGRITSPSLAVDLRNGERFEAEFTVRQEATDLLEEAADAAVLPDLETSASRAAAEARMSTFDQRRTTGLGLYLTEADFQRRESATVNDILRNVSGVRINCSRGQCVPVIARAPLGCTPAYFMDDMLVDAGVVANIRSTEIRGIEIYQGLSQLPPELGRELYRARCGAFVVWSKRGPEPRPRTQN